MLNIFLKTFWHTLLEMMLILSATMLVVLKKAFFIKEIIIQMRQNLKERLNYIQYLEENIEEVCSGKREIIKNKESYKLDNIHK